MVAIKKREEETRKQFLQNPIQLKKLQSTLDKQLRKKKKKFKKHRNSIDIDILIAEKLQSLKNNSVDLSSITNSSHISNESDLDKILIKKFRKYKSRLTEGDITEILDTNKDEVTSSSKSDNDEDSNFIPKGRSKNMNRGKNWDSKTYKKFEHQNDKNHNIRNSRTRLTEEEKEKRRKEMMENAMWRDKERTNNVKRYREEDATESKIQRNYNPDFIHKELMKSANSGSVESRIKSNINSIQRSKSDMNMHFSKRM